MEDMGTIVTEKELVDEVEKAKSFEPKISEFVLVTTAENDAKIQKLARKITEENKKSGLFSVTVFGWEEIVRKLSVYEELIEKYYPNQSLRLGGIESALGELNQTNQKNEIALDEMGQTLKDILNVVSDQKAKAILSQDDGHVKSDANDIYNKEIDGYKSLLIDGRPDTAKGLLLKLKERCWEDVSDYVKFRIITNIASCDLSLDDKEEAINGFRLAYDYAQESDIANANIILSLILENDIESANAKAASALERFPDNESILSHYISTYGDSQVLLKPEEIIPSSLSRSGMIAYSFYGYYQSIGMVEESKKWLSDAYVLDPEKHEIRFSYASGLLESIRSEKGFFPGKNHAEEVCVALNECVELFGGLFEEIINSEAISLVESVGNNLALAYRFLGKTDEAISVCEKALSKVGDSNFLKKLKAALYGDVENWGVVLDALSGIDDDQSVLMKVEAFFYLGDFSSARNCIQDFLSSSEPRPEIKGLLDAYLVDIDYEVDGYDSIDKYEESFVEGSIHVALSLSKIHRKEGNLDRAIKYTSDALENHNVEKCVEAFSIAEEAYFCGLLWEAQSIYDALSNYYVDTPAFRRLIACLYDLDDRKRLSEIISGLPDELRQDEYYSLYAASFYIRVGDDVSAENEIDHYLAIHPVNLQLALNKVGILYRSNRLDEAEKFINGLSPNDAERPIHQMQLAFAKAELGNSHEAVDMAYQLRRRYSDDADINQKYVGLILSDKVKLAPYECLNVRPGTSVTVEVDGRDREYYICEPDEQPLNDQELLTSHPISRALIGSKVGELVSYQENPLTERVLSVKIIKNKYLYLLHDTMGNFSHRFPGEGAMYSVQLKNDAEGDFDLSPIFEQIDQHAAFVEEGIELYKKYPMPVCKLAAYLGVNPLSLWSGLQREGGALIYCAIGSNHERESAFKVVNSGAKFIADPLTAIHIIDLNLIDAVENVLGKLAVTQSALDLLNGLIQEEKTLTSNGSMTLHKSGDQYIRHERSSEEIDLSVERLTEVRDLISHRFDVVSAVGGLPEAQEAVDFFADVHPSFVDTIFVSSNEGYALLSDDNRLRGIAKLGWAVDSTWVQPVITVARDKGLMSHEEYSESISQYVLRNFSYISVDSDVLYELAKKNNFRITGDFIEVVKILGVKHSDLNSAIIVMTRALNRIGAETVSCLGVYDSFVFLMLNVLTEDGCSPETIKLLKYFYMEQHILHKEIFLRAVKMWSEGHFLGIDFPF